MGRSFRAGRVFQTAVLNLKHARTPKDAVVPVWMNVMDKIPPTELLTRPRPTAHQDPDPRMRRPRRIFRPQKITFPEDELRRNFFKDHPWELARPRVVVELDGKDAWGVDWSKGLRQPGRQVTGESVVQMQMWLMENGKTEYVTNEATGHKEAIHKPLSKEEAYDMARSEFYVIRQEEQIEKRIAHEEARMVGAYFGKDRLQISMELEDDTFERWKKWAETESAQLQAKRDAAYSSFGDEEADSPAVANLLAEDQAADSESATPPPPLDGKGPQAPRNSPRF